MRRTGDPIVCRKCAEAKPADQFRVRQRTCVPCDNAWKVAHRDRNKEKYVEYERSWRDAKKARIREINFEQKYGFGLDVVREAFAAQGGVCPICGINMSITTHAGDKRRACVDHCHDTGAFRALLCRMCNSGMGLLGDDADRLESAARYLRLHRRGPRRRLTGS